MAKYTDKTTVSEILRDPEMLAIIKKYLPTVEDNPMLNMAKGMTLSAIRGFLPNEEAKNQLENIIAELKALG